MLLLSLPPPSTGDLLFLKSDLFFFYIVVFLLFFSLPPDSARCELLMSMFSLPLGSSGNSWPQSGLISMHEPLHPAFYLVEFLLFKLVGSALESVVKSASGVSRLHIT